MSRSVWLWRVRRNPLRPRSYAVEAWALLAAGVVTIAGAAITGVAVADDVRYHLDRQRTQRQPTTAVLTQDVSAQAGYPSDRFAQVARTAPDGTRHTARTEAGAARKSGDTVKVWTDDRGHLTAAPLDDWAARLEATTDGAAAGMAVGGLGLLGCGIAARLCKRRRAEEWATEWTVVGPRWDRRTA
jgi:hypothetical protein